MKLRLEIIALMLMLAFPRALKGQPDKIQLLPQNAKADWAAVSPNGKWIAFTVRGKPPDDAPTGLYITTSDGQAVSTITQGITANDDLGYPRWSPDSSYILFYDGNIGNGSNYQRTIVASVDGKILSQTESSNPISEFGPWRFDSKAYFSFSESASCLAVIGLDGKQAACSPKIVIQNAWLGISPDGKTLAVTTGQGIVLMDSVTFNTVATLLDTEAVNGVGWSPDGKKLLVDLSRPNNYLGEMLVLDTTGKELGSFDITTTFHDVQWSPDSTTLAVINEPTKNSPANVTFYSADGKVLGSSAMSGQDPSMDLEFSTWTPDNTYMLLTTKGDLVAVHADGSMAHNFAFTSNTYGGDIAQPYLNWSPNGKLLALAPNITDGRAKEIWIYTTDGKLLRKLERPVNEENGSYFWSADSTSLILLNDGYGVWLVAV